MSNTYVVKKKVIGSNTVIEVTYERSHDTVRYEPGSDSTGVGVICDSSMYKEMRQA